MQTQRLLPIMQMHRYGPIRRSLTAMFYVDVLDGSRWVIRCSKQSFGINGVQVGISQVCGK